MRDKVVFLCTQKEAGGVQTRATQMQQSMSMLGYDTDVVFLYTKREPFPENRNHISLLSRPPTGLLDFAKIFWRLSRYMRSNRPVAIVGFAHYASPIAAIFGFLAGAKTRIATQTNPISSVPKVGQCLDYFCGVVGLFTCNIAASKAVFDGFSDYPSHYRSRLKLIYNGVQSRAYSMGKEESRDSFGLPRGVKLLICCGRLSKQKNHQFLLPLLASLDDVHLAILGDGELRVDIEAEAKQLGVRGRLHLMGELPANEVGRFLRAGDVFVFPSMYEAFGLALVEAMLEGLPVVTSDHPALVEVVGDGGFILPHDASRWKSILERLLADPKLRCEMGQKAKMQASKFTYEAMFSNYLAEIIKFPVTK